MNLTDDFLRGVSEDYVRHVSEGRYPSPAIADSSGVPLRTVQRWVLEARKRGILTAPAPSFGRVHGREGETSLTVRSNIRRLRQSRGYTYVELSRLMEELGCRVPVLGLRRIERGERRVDVDDLVALSRILGVTPADLLSPVDADPPAR